MEQNIQKAIETVDKFPGSSERVKALQNRVKRCVCKACGTPLVLRKLTYGKIEEGRVEIFCPSCNKIEYGVEPEVYKVAKYYVEVMNWDYYSDLEASDRKTRMNVSKAAEIINWAMDALGMVNEYGFSHPVMIRQELLGEELLLNDELL